MYQIIEHLNQLEWTPRLVTEFLVSGVTLLAIFVGWLKRGWRIKSLDHRLKRIEQAANTISVDEWRQVQEHLEDSGPLPNQELRGLRDKLTVLESAVKSLAEKNYVDCDKFGLTNQTERFKVVLINELGITDPEVIEQIVNAGIEPPKEKPPEPEVLPSVRLLSVLTGNDELDLDDEEDLPNLISAAQKAGGGKVTDEIVDMVALMCDAEYHHTYILGMLNAKAKAQV